MAPRTRQVASQRATPARVAGTAQASHPDRPRSLPEPLAVEPLVPFRRLRWDMFSTEVPYDAVYLCRSPGFTPASCDPIFDLIRERFIDEDAWSH